MKKINKTRKITENDLRNLHYIHENEGLIPDGVTKLEDEDITSAEVITENKKSKVNESEDDEYTREDYENDLGGYLISLPYEKVKAYKKINAKLTSEEIGKLQQKYDELEHDSVDLDDKLASGEITEEKYYKVRANLIKKSLKIFRKLTGGCDPDWYDPDEMGDLDPDLNGGVNESDATYNIDYWVDKKDPGDTKEEANNILRMLGYPSDPSQPDLEEIIKHFDVDYNGDSDYEEYIVTLLGYYYLMFGRTEFYKNYVSKYGVAVNESSLETSNQYWEFIQKFKESVGEDSEVYKELMTQLQAIKDFNVYAAYNLTKEFLENKGLWDEYSSDFETIPVNEDDMDEFQKLIDSDVWKKFREDWKDTDVYDTAMEAISYVDTLPQMINALKKVLTEYDMLIDYEAELDKLLSTSVNEYKTVGVYKPNDGEVEDLYYIQAGDIILIHHKDYGELQCKVKKVDADKNKVYFVTIERGIMGVCGFDKIHGIQLVEECQKQPVFVQTKHIKFPEGGMCYMCYAKVGSRFVDVYCTFGMSLDNCECIKLLNMTEDEFGIIDNIMSDSDTVDDAKNRVYNSGLVSL